MQTVKFAIAGFGHIGKRHAAMIAQNPGAQLVAVIDNNADAAERSAPYNVPLFATLEDFFDAPNDADVVVIATPNAFHAKQALQSLHAGKHVVIEKPMTLKRHDAEKIIHTALSLHKNVFVVMQNRYSAPAVWLKQTVDSGVLGELYYVQLNCFWNRDERYYTSASWHRSKELDGGILFTQFSHFVDLLYWVFGDIDNITASMHSFNHRHLNEFEDTGMVNFKFTNGGMGSLHFSTAVWDKNLESSITIIAEKGSIKIGGQYMDKIEYCHIKDYELSQPGDGQNASANHHFIIQNVIDVLHAKNAISTNALEGLKVVEIIERMYQAAKLAGNNI